MNAPKTLWVWIFLALGGAFILLSVYLNKPTTLVAPVPAERVLAHVEHLTGNVFVVRQGLLQREKIDQRAVLGPLDSVETGEIGEARLDFDSAFRVRIKEQTLATLEKVGDQNGFHVVLIIKRGDVSIENYGHEGDLFIAKNGERISATDYQNSPLAHSKTEEIPLAATPGPAASGSPLVKSAEASPSENEIQDVMNAHRTSFLKCYTQLLQKDPRAKGDVSLNFTVENSGKMGAIDVTSVNLTQADFKKCLKDVMARIEFRSFHGTPISTLFPLKFE